MKQRYKLSEKVTQDRWAYVEIRKGMYILLQAGLLVQDLLAQRLAPHGYTQSKFAPDL